MLLLKAIIGTAGSWLLLWAIYMLIRYEEVLVLKEKWDGKLPQVTGGVTPLLNLGN